MAKYGNKSIFDYELDEIFIKIISDKDIFLNNILSAWINVQASFNTNKTKLIAKTIIWNNKTFTQNGKTCFYNKSYEKGIMYLEHCTTEQKHSTILIYFQDYTISIKLNTLNIFKS